MAGTRIVQYGANSPATGAPRIVEAAVPTAAPDPTAMMAAMIEQIEALKAQLAAKPAKGKSDAAPVPFDPMGSRIIEWEGNGFKVAIGKGVMVLTVDMAKGERESDRGNRAWTAAGQHGAIWLRCNVAVTKNGLPMTRGRK